KEQKKAIRWKHKNASDLSGYESLKPEDKARVRESIGLNEAGQGTPNPQNTNTSRQDQRTDAKGKGKAKESENGFQANVPGSSRQTTGSSPASPEQFQWWHDSAPSWDNPETTERPQGAVSPSKGKKWEAPTKQGGRTIEQPKEHAPPVPSPVGPPPPANGPNALEQMVHSDLGNRLPLSIKENTPVKDSPVAHPGPPAAPKTEVDP
ncbi:hypothetical protein FRC01_012905, partial [Tulasnella sp. 417]